MYSYTDALMVLPNRFVDPALGLFLSNHYLHRVLRYQLGRIYLTCADYYMCEHVLTFTLTSNLSKLVTDRETDRFNL
jgi:hypothetical protein